MTGPTPVSSRESHFTRAYCVYHNDAPGALARPFDIDCASDPNGNLEMGGVGVGNRLLVNFDYYLEDSVPAAATDIIDFEFCTLGEWQWSAQSPSLYGGGVAGAAAFIANNRPCLMDIRPVEHPSQARATRLDAQWEIYRLPDPRAEYHPFRRLLPYADFKDRPSVFITSVCDKIHLLVWANARGGDAAVPTLKAGEWLTVTVFAGGLAGTF